MYCVLDSINRADRDGMPQSGPHRIELKAVRGPGTLEGPDRSEDESDNQVGDFLGIGRRPRGFCDPDASV